MIRFRVIFSNGHEVQTLLPAATTDLDAINRLMSHGPHIVSAEILSYTVSEMTYVV